MTVADLGNLCRRCLTMPAADDLSALCHGCSAHLRDAAGRRGREIQSAYDPAADHRSPDERRRED